MKKLFSLAIIIAAPFFILSCQNDAKEELIEKPFKPVTLTLSAVMDMEENSQTKADQYPTDFYTLDYIYLMVKTGPSVYDSYMIDLITEEGQKMFDLRITSVSPTEIYLASNGIDLVTVSPGQELFFSSHPDCLVETTLSDFSTPNGGDVYSPFGKDLYKSANSAIEFIEGGFKIGDKEYIANQHNTFELLMYRLTGSFRTKVIFFKQATPQDMKPLTVTPDDWYDAGLGDYTDWTVTPYLRNYYYQFMICDGPRGSVTGLNNAVYLLSQGAKNLIQSTEQVNRIGVGDHTLTETLIARTNPDYFPYLFNGDISNSKISFFITNGDNQFLQELYIADVNLPQTIMPNDYKTLNVCINIAELNENNQLKGTIDSNNVFFFWE